MKSNSRSQEIYGRALKVMPGGSTRITLHAEPYPHYAAVGHGCWVRDVDGEEKLDLLNNFFSLIHGHSHPAITNAVVEQISRGTCFGMPTELDVKMAEELCSRVESLDTVRFMNSGSEAVLAAIKAARAYTGRPKIAKIEGAYHGMYDYAEVSQTSTPDNWGDDLPRSIGYARGVPRSVLDDVVVIPLNDVERSIRALEPEADNLAAVLLDLMPSRCGMILAEADYLTAIVNFCKEHGILIVLDEVVSLRLAVGGAQSLAELRPDLTVMGKIIGGGFPVGAVGGRRDVMAVFDPRQGKPWVPHGGTFTANPVCMTAGLTALSLLSNSEIARLNALGDRMRKMLTDAIGRIGCPGSVTGFGSLFRIHLKEGLIRDYRSAYQDSTIAALTTTVHRGLFARGVIVSTNLSGALSTPMKDDQIDVFEDAFSETLAAVFLNSATR